MPNYLRTTTNKYKGLITEKVALNYLRNKGFACLDFTNACLTAEDMGKRELEIKEYWEKRIRDEKERYKRDLKEYSSKSPPKGWQAWRGEVELTWEEYRKEQLELAHRRIKAQQNHYPVLMEREIEFERIWRVHFEPIKNYSKWLREHEHYWPDFIARRGDKVFIIEVKSQTREKTSLFGEHQKKALLKAYDFGLTPMLLIVPINLNIEIGEPELREIEKTVGKSK